jgi:hypothetical protein
MNVLMFINKIDECEESLVGIGWEQTWGKLVIGERVP